MNLFCRRKQPFDSHNGTGLVPEPSLDRLANPPHMLNQTGGGEKFKSAGSSKSPETIIRESLNDLFQRERRDSEERTLLHIACRSFSTSDPYDDLFPPYTLLSSPPTRVDTIRLLIDSGADPNACDAKGDAPLHVLAKFNGELVDSAANLLLEKGAHFDRVNKSGKTVADVWIELNKGADEWSDRPSWCRQSVPTPLMCQCAQVIRANKVSYSLYLPVALHPFVEIH